MGISSLTACSRTPGSDSTELDYATSRYFQALYRIVNKTFHPAVLEEFHQIADALASCVAAHEDYFTAYPDAKAAYGLMVQIPDILEQNLEPNADGNYVLRELPEEWLFCIFELWHYVYPGVYGAEHSTENCTDAVLLKWIADDAFNGGWSPCHWWLDCYLTGSQYHVCLLYTSSSITGTKSERSHTAHIMKVFAPSFKSPISSTQRWRTTSASAARSRGISIWM